MKTFNNFDFSPSKNSVVTIGNFDGLHLGHKQLIKTTTEIASNYNLNSIVVSFSNHPKQVLLNQKFLYILSQNEKELELSKDNIDIFINYPFDLNFSNLSPIDFFNILYFKLKCKFIVVGEDYSFGKGKSGNVDTLISIAKKFDVHIVKIKNLTIDGNRISSSKIRECLVNKDVLTANVLLNRPYYISGIVQQCKKLGTTIGFPTANIFPSPEKLLLPDGTYITKTIVENSTFISVTNIGKSPTVNSDCKTIETHILDFDKNIYGYNIKVLFFAFSRNMLKFNSIDELKAQIFNDTINARSFFEKFS